MSWPDRWIRWTTIACVGLLALIAGPVSYLHMHALVATRIFAEYLAGRGLFAIVEGLTRDGIPSPSQYDPARNRHRSGQGWSKAAVRAILSKPATPSPSPAGQELSPSSAKGSCGPCPMLSARVRYWTALPVAQAILALPQTPMRRR